MVTKTRTVNIKVGANFPATASVSDVGGVNDAHSMLYQPSVTTLFNGTVDGKTFDARFQQTRLQAFAKTPEPTSLLLFAIASLGTLLGRRFHAR